MSDQELITELFKRYEPAVQRFLGSKISHKEDVEDVLQETFLRAHKVPNWSEVENSEAYLIRIARNAYNDYRRQGKGIYTTEPIEFIQNAVIDEGPTPEDCTARQQQIQNLEVIIKKLTPRVRQAMIFIKVLELSYDETSKIMGISRSTLKNHITAGMAECRLKAGVPIDFFERETGKTGKVISISEHKYVKK